MVRRLFGATAEALIMVILVFGLLAVPVLGARGHGGEPAGGGGTLNPVVMDVTDSTQTNSNVSRSSSHNRYRPSVADFATAHPNGIQRAVSGNVEHMPDVVGPQR